MDKKEHGEYPRMLGQLIVELTSFGSMSRELCDLQCGNSAVIRSSCGFIFINGS